MTDPSESQTEAGPPQVTSPATAAAVPWYRRRWALIVGAVAAAAVLFLGGLAVGATIWGGDQSRFDRHGGRFDHGGWGGRDEGCDRMAPPGQGPGGHGWRHDDHDRGHGRGEYDRSGSPDGPRQGRAPSVTPSPTPSPPQSDSQ